MLSTRDTTNNAAGRHLRKPSEAASEPAHTASRAPETIRMNHAMTNPSESVLSWCGYSSLVRAPDRKLHRQHYILRVTVAHLRSVTDTGARSSRYKPIPVALSSVAVDPARLQGACQIAAD